MWKRKQDFRPDKTGADFISKLYITKKQRLNLLQWILFSVLLVVLSLLQDVIFCRLRIAGASTDLMAAGILLLCMMLTTDHCAVFAVVASTLYYFSGSAAGPYCILFLTGLGILLNIFRYSYLRKSFFSTLLCAAAALTIYELLVFCTGSFLEYTHLSRLPGFLITAGLSVAATPILYPFFLWIGNIGGDTWKE